MSFMKQLSVPGRIAVGSAILLSMTVVALMLYQLFSGPKVNKATKSDVAFVLNWGGLSAHQSYTVLSSYESAVSFNGDLTDYYCIQLSSFHPDKESQSGWQFGPEKNSIFADAEEIALGSAKPSKCFGRSIDPRNANIAKYIWSLRAFGRNVAGAKLIFFDRRTKRLLYVDFQT